MQLFIVIVILVVIISIFYNSFDGNRKKVFEQNLKNQGFSTDKESYGLYVDNTNKLWSIYQKEKGVEPKIYKFCELIDFELLENDVSTVKGGFGKAIVGGMLLGTTGAILGSAGSRKITTKSNNISVVVRTNDLNSPVWTIQILKNVEIDKNLLSPIIQELLGMLTYISSNGNEIKLEQIENKENSGISSIEEIRELNKLKADGIITEAEFEAKKKQLLNL